MALFLAGAAGSAGVNAQSDDLDFLTGKALFERQWISPPASTTASDGLGPLYNATSCDTCHPDGGSGKISGENPFSQGLVLHFSDSLGRQKYGHQWQPFAVRGMQAEAFSARFERVEHTVTYADGQEVVLQRLQMVSRAEDLPDEAVFSLRLAPELHGIALFEQVVSIGGSSGMVFGWQASVEDIRTQTGIALSRDLGLGNPVLPSPAGDCTDEQAACLALAAATLSGETPEVSETVVGLLTDYVRGLDVPATHEPDHREQGFVLFGELGCTQCHQPWLSLDSGARLTAYTDLLTHDMGDGLSDRMGTDRPVPTRWRTPALWSLQERIRSGSGAFLHDGRASTVEEAVLWHDGESASARDAFMALSRAEREALLAWLASL